MRAPAGLLVDAHAHGPIDAVAGKAAGDASPGSDAAPSTVTVVDCPDDAVSGRDGQLDGRFEVDYDQDVCRRFEAAGRFPFFCWLHGFDAELIVE